jgi:hypothetical protein
LLFWGAVRAGLRAPGMVYRNYFTGVEQTNLKLRELRPSVDRVTLGLGLVSFLGCLMTIIYMWSVR